MNLENLNCLSMTKLKSKKLWERVQPLTPIMAMLSPSLESLCLSDISTLVELPSSFQNLHQLGKLEIKNCINLETLPTGINLQSLLQLDLSGCSRLRTFPGISTNIRILCLSETGIEEVPRWIKTFYRLEDLQMNGCNNLEYVYLNFCKYKYGLYVNFSHCTALTGVGWCDSPRRDIYLDFTNCFNLDQEALLLQKTYFQSQLRLSGEEVPSYFTHRTNGTSSFLTVPLLPSSLSQPFLRFRACILFNDNMSDIDAEFRFTGSFWNCSDTYDQEQDFCADTEDYKIFLYDTDSCLFILDCQMSHIPLEMNFDHLDMQIHVNHSSDMEIDIKDSFGSPIDIKEWGIRIIEVDCSAADNRLGNPDTLPHVFEGNMINVGGQGEECGGEDEVTEPSSKRMRIS
ncbi:hypothetical protein Bca101_065322 [Brassica carinata]